MIKNKDICPICGWEMSEKGLFNRKYNTSFICPQCSTSIVLKNKIRKYVKFMIPITLLHVGFNENFYEKIGFELLGQVLTPIILFTIIILLLSYPFFEKIETDKNA